MAVQLISYDLRKAGHHYAELFAAIEALGATRWHCLESVWLVRTSSSSQEVRDALTPHIGPQDKLLVVALSGNWASVNLHPEDNDWLRKNLAA